MTALLAAIPGYYSVFSAFAPHDDEGYILLSLKNYLDVGGLYDRVYTQYGPFFYESLGAVYRITGRPVTFDSGRDLTLAMWIVTSFLCGLSIARLTRSTLLGIAGTVIVSKLLLSYPGEPLHPGHMLAMLLAAVLAIAVLGMGSRPELAMVAMGVISGAALLVKINVGLFAGIAVVFAAVFALVSGPSVRWARPLTVVLAVAVPFALMAKKFGKGWGDGLALPFSIHVALAILALGLASTTVAALAALPRARAWRTVGAFLAGAGALVVVSAIGVLVDGTSFRGLIDGVVVHPLRQADVLFGVVVIPTWVVTLDVLAVGAAALIAWWGAEVWAALRSALALGRVLAGGAILLVLAQITPVAGSRVLWLPLSLAWIAALPSTRDVDSFGSRYLRVFVPAFAVFESMHAYPVSGSQIAWASFLFVVVGAVSIADGIADFAAWLETRAPAKRRFHANASAVLLGVIAIDAIFVALLLPLQTYSRGYNHGVAINAPGTARIRVPRGTADAYREMTAALKLHCSTFVSLPGLNSFYFLTGEPAPTLLNAGDWMYLFDTAQQQKVVDAVQGIPKLCAIRHDGISGFWQQGRPLPDKPLVRFIDTHFKKKPVFSVAGFKVLVRKT